MQQLGLKFETRLPTFSEEDRLLEVRERTLSLEACCDLAQDLAWEKARSVLQTLAAGAGEKEYDVWVLASDTIVVLDGLVLGKPSDAEDARSMLRRLSGRSHHVVSGLALVRGDGRRHTGAAVTRVTFRDLSPPLVDAYVATGEPMDKAGSYGIQGKGASLVQGIEGCYFNVMGLPVALLCDLLAEEGIAPWTGWNVPVRESPSYQPE